jgi:predicted GH43/DUF377 family glycosyl hydrolase
MKLKKYYNNPILEPLRGSYWEAAQVRNPAAVLHDGKVHLIYTAAGDMDIEHKIYLGHAVSTDGIHFERVDSEPFAAPFKGTFDAGGIEDPRAVKIDDNIYITYCARAVPHWSFIQGERYVSPPTNGVTWTENYRRGGLISTKDFITCERHGPITSDDHYDCNIILFPEKINGKYVMLHRPSYFKAEVESGNGGTSGISICFSDDLTNWEDDYPLIDPEFEWEDLKVGGSSPPIKTPEGWLVLYHAVQRPLKDKSWHPCFQFCYRAGVMLLDLDNPTRVIARSPHYILEPETPFEKFGTVNNVVFPTGNVVLGDELFIYYGAADTTICLATVQLNELLKYVLRFRV